MCSFKIHGTYMATSKQAYMQSRLNIYSSMRGLSRKLPVFYDSVHTHWSKTWCAVFSQY